MNRVFNEFGIFHFVSQSFDPVSVKTSVTDEVERSVDDLLKRVSTVIIDEDESDSFTIRVDSTGFYPSNVAIRKVRFCHALLSTLIHAYWEIFISR